MIEVRILGPFEARRAGRSLPLGGPKQRALLAYLALQGGRVVSSDELVEALWPEQPADAARNALRVAVSRLRGSLDGEASIDTRAPGYVLEIPNGQIDLTRFEELSEQGGQALAGGDPAAAASLLTEALALWRGRALGDLIGEPVLQREADRLDELRLATLEQRVEADLACGRHRELVGELERLADEHPYRETFVRQLMLALYRSRRQADALEAFSAARSRLVDDLGIEPTPELRELERAILGQDPGLGTPPVRPPPEAPAPPAPRRARLLPALVAAALLTVAATAAALLMTRDGSNAPSLRPGTLTVATNSVAVVDADTGELAANIRIGSRPTQIAEDGGVVWVAAPDNQSIARVPAGSRAVQRVGVPVRPDLLDAAYGQVWIADASGLRLARLDPRDGLPLDEAEADVPPPLAALAVGRNRIWFESYFLAQVERLDSRTGRIDGSFGRGGRGSTFYDASDVHIAATATDVYFTNRVDAADERSGRLTRIDPVSGDATARIFFGGAPRAIALGDDAIWVATDDGIWRIDAGDTAPTTVIPLREPPVALAAGDDSVWVATRERSLLRIDTGENRVVQRLRLTRTPSDLELVDGELWVAVTSRF